MKVSLFTAIIVLIVGLYDMAFSYNRRRHNQQGGTTVFMILGIIFVIGGIAMMILHWVK
ncbi:DUF308 domain-containing protein [Lactobacillus sp. ESL0677]|uniref:DUF308 domain-containing protein n=1 Tax=Lactobacillus sp. ESL0677 TaxID=2983208 RepID=UPI0023F95182|nr:DUF308 domain-containing protein [Lactobacillus sp. ESL0677]WEV36595.1 DUF308 domain-containing protein [Lactobacillus sp. ESL0677]